MLIEPTHLDGLLSQIVYVKLVGLSREDAAAALIALSSPDAASPPTNLHSLASNRRQHHLHA